jgi:hypothetical protein
LEQCNKCAFYDKDYDELRRSGDDVVIPNTPDVKHYCRMYEKFIDNDIVTDKKECQYFIQNE